jgi:hypothetical protein
MVIMVAMVLVMVGWEMVGEATMDTVGMAFRRDIHQYIDGR